MTEESRVTVRPLSLEQVLERVAELEAMVGDCTDIDCEEHWVTQSELNSFRWLAKGAS